MSVFFGEPEGVNVGDVFPSRQALIENNLHRTNQRGIDGNSNEGSSAIVLSGGYEDDLDFGDTILYTGEGGNENGVQVSHQSFESPGNAGLLLSYRKNLPIRVIRSSNHNSPFSPKSGYKYCGLYEIIEEPQIVIGKSGFNVCRFKLKQIRREPSSVQIGCVFTIRTPSIQNDMTYVIGENHPTLRTIASSSGLAKAALGKKVGETFDFGPNTYTVEDVCEYLS